MIVRGTDAEAVLLDRALANMHKYVDGIFITSTYAKGEKPNARVHKVAEDYNATVSEFEWVNDFASARNFNFAQVPQEYDYIMWSDADDIWRGLDKLKDTLEKHPLVDGFAVWYMYEWDEWKKPVVVHQKTMIVKNDGCVKWVGELHEDLQPTRYTDTQFIEGIDRLHLTTPERAEENRKRNLIIATKQVKDDPNEPRSYWNLANSLIGLAKYDEAADAFSTFLEMSESEQERYLAFMRMGDLEKHRGNQAGAIRYLQLAIGMCPELPDAYLQLGAVYYEFQNWDKAEHYTLQGLLKRPKERDVIVFNPRDYDYNPMMMLAKIYYQINRPDLMLPILEGCLKIYPDDKRLKSLVKEGREQKNLMEKALIKIQKLQSITDKEKLKKELARLPQEIASHPMIASLRNTHFIKEESSGRDMVIYCGNTVVQWNPETVKTKGIGGSEEAALNLSREFAKAGWNVTVYNNCGHKAVIDDVVGDMGDGVFKDAVVTYRPFWEYNYRDKQDVTVLWRTTKPLDADINSKLIFVDLHDVTQPTEFSPQRVAKLTKIMVKTKFHRSFLKGIPDEKIEIVPNGMDFALLEGANVKKDPLLVINTSSPDRSLDVLPELWKRVKEQVPEAKLKWCYGWDLFAKVHANDQKKIAWMKDTQKAMQEAGIEDLGRITQAEVGKLYQEASILAYPSEFAEIDCISVKKAQAAGCFPVTTDFGAFEESIPDGQGIKVHSEKTIDTWCKPYQFHFGIEEETAKDAWVQAVVDCLNLIERGGTLQFAGTVDKWKQQYNWGQVARQWLDLMQ